MTDIQPQTKHHERRLYVRENIALKNKIESLEDQVAHYQEQIEKLTTGSIPQIVKNWMHEYRLPWELFWCYEHEEWITELDSNFPYHTERNICDRCSN